MYKLKTISEQYQDALIICKATREFFIVTALDLDKRKATVENTDTKSTNVIGFGNLAVNFRLV